LSVNVCRTNTYDKIRQNTIYIEKVFPEYYYRVKQSGKRSEMKKTLFCIEEEMNTYLKSAGWRQGEKE